MTVYRLDPLEDSRWSRLVASHPHGSVFHTHGWLNALKRTYGYTPIAFTTCPPDAQLHSGVVFCQIQSWLTGSRLVSLPFSDHCEPLTDGPEQLSAVIGQLDAERKVHGWRYIELRPLECTPAGSSFSVSAQFVLHSLRLCPESDRLFHQFHKSSTQRKILRAQREHITYEEGRGLDLLQDFYRLLVITRRRHGLPPQPFAWFRNLAECLGEAMTVRVARYRGKPVASIVTLRHQSTMVYKYGASDQRAHPLGAVHSLFWKAIQDASVGGCASLDLGRTDLQDTGLSTFKERWGARGVPLRYWRSPVQAVAPAREGMARRGVRRVPNSLRIAMGRALYKHFG